MKSRTEVPVKVWVSEAKLSQQQRVLALFVAVYRFLISALHTVGSDTEGGLQNVAISFKSSLQF